MNKLLPRTVSLMAVFCLMLLGCPPEDNPPSFPVEFNAGVAAMVAAVHQDDVAAYIGNLSGENAVTIGGEDVVLTTRNTENEEMSALATQYVYEFMEGLGLAVRYQEWDDTEEEVSGRNVIGELEGSGAANEIVLITAHLDDMPEEGPAPGADDNGSGSAGVMTAAATMAGQNFSRTVRFALFTGEEYGPSGSAAYARECSDAEETIVAVLNMDVMGWDANDDGIMYLGLRKTNADGYSSDKAIADAFVNAAAVYGIAGLTIKLDPSGFEDVDNASFWAVGYPAILIIEDEEVEANPNWHEPTDTLDTLNMPYCTKIIQTTVGAAAHIALPE